MANLYISKLKRRHASAATQASSLKAIANAALVLIDLYGVKNGAGRVFDNMPVAGAVVAWSNVHAALKKYGITEIVGAVVNSTVPTPGPVPTPVPNPTPTPTPVPNPTPTPTPVPDPTPTPTPVPNPTPTPTPVPNPTPTPTPVPDPTPTPTPTPTAASGAYVFAQGAKLLDVVDQYGTGGNVLQTVKKVFNETGDISQQAALDAFVLVVGNQTGEFFMHRRDDMALVASIINQVLSVQTPVANNEISYVVRAGYADGFIANNTDVDIELLTDIACYYSAGDSAVAFDIRAAGVVTVSSSRACFYVNDWSGNRLPAYQSPIASYYETAVLAEDALTANNYDLNNGASVQSRVVSIGFNP